MGRNQSEILKHPQTRFLNIESQAERPKDGEKYQDEWVGFLANVHASLCVVVDVVAGDQASTLQSQEDA